MKRVLRQCWWRRLASSHLLPALPAGALGMAAGLRTVAASCAILPLSWDHRRRGCPPSKTGFRPRSRHLRSRPSSTGPRRAAHTGGLCRRSAAYPLSIAYSRAAWAATLASPGLLPILLLVGSNLFMTLAWYGHLRFKEVPGAACAQLPSLPRSCGNVDSPKLARRGGQTSVQMAVRLHSRLHPG